MPHIWGMGMTRAYSVDLHERVVQPVSGGGSGASGGRDGRSQRGARLVSAIPHGHWKTTTFVAGLRQDGLTAPFVIDRPMNGAIFLAYIERCPAPTLSPGDIVVMDNLPAHKVAGVRQAIRAREAELLYRPLFKPGAGSTRPISTRARCSSPSSKRCCAKPPNARSRHCGPESANCSTNSPATNAAIISLMPATSDRKHALIGRVSTRGTPLPAERVAGCP